MRLRARARCALRMMIEVARSSKSANVSLAEVAGRTKISRRYLDQVAMSLRNAALIRGQSGKGGGYQLTKPAANVSVGQIVEAAMGPVNVVECVGRPGTCTKSDRCECRWLYALINRRITDVLEEISLEELANKRETRGLLDDCEPFGHACPEPQ